MVMSIMDLIQDTEGVEYPRFICENEDYRGLNGFSESGPCRASFCVNVDTYFTNAHSNRRPPTN